MRYLTLIGTLIGAVIGWLWVANGIQLSWDSEAYLGAARELQKFGGIPQDWASYPPLYPILLAAFPSALMITGASILNIVAFAATLSLLLLLFPRTPQALVIVLICAASPALHLVHTFVWTEPLYITLVVLFIYGIGRRSVPIMLAAASMAALQRYVGVALVPAGVVAIWLLHGKVVRDARPYGLFILGALLPVGIWMARNLVLTGTPMGVRIPGDLSWGMSIDLTARTILAWVPLLLIASLLAPRPRLSGAMQAAVVVYSVAHCAIVIYGAATTNLDPPDDRLLSPVFIPLLLLVAGRLGLVIRRFFNTTFLPKLS